MKSLILWRKPYVNDIACKYVQCTLDIDTYLKIREFATLQGFSLEKTIRLAIINFIKDREINKNGSKKA